VSEAKPVAWTIAGSDSGGGAGIQADLQTFAAFGVHGASVLTSLTAQNACGVRVIEPVSPMLVRAQCQALAENLQPRAIKTGLLGGPEALAVLLEALEALPQDVPCVVDPVLVASSGDRLLPAASLAGLIRDLLPRARLVTPNFPEAERLTGQQIRSTEDQRAAAHRLLECGPGSVLLKGGHGAGELSQDFWTDGHQEIWLSSPRRPDRRPHGTGCTLSAAITAGLAQGHDLLDAIVMAKAYVNRALRTAYRPSATPESFDYLTHAPWPAGAEDYPWITPRPEEAYDRTSFPGMGPEPLGFYPIVDRASWLARFLPLGVRTIQLRIKDLRGEALAAEIAAAVKLARRYDSRLFINDYWELARATGAYGVHLGQEDLATADLPAIARAGLRLGISTHCHAEAARAHALRPSYVAIGPIFPTTLKAMRFAPQGISALRDWRALLPYPLVAIGGLRPEHVPALREAGADGGAVISDVLQHADPKRRAREWMAAFKAPAGTVRSRLSGSPRPYNQYLLRSACSPSRTAGNS
jgi:hydroxymethylpyrimidine kinase/phosphomethylpyrimidine kinase/thiamine-phosphate diphosphorylase